MRLFQAPLDTCLGSPFFASLSVHGLHFTVYAPSIFRETNMFLRHFRWVRKHFLQDDAGMAEFAAAGHIHQQFHLQGSMGCPLLWFIPKIEQRR